MIAVRPRQNKEAVGRGRHVANAAASELDEQQFGLVGAGRIDARDGYEVFAQDRSAKAEIERTVLRRQPLDVDPVLLARQGREGTQHRMLVQNRFRLDPAPRSTKARLGVDAKLQQDVPALADIGLEFDQRLAVLLVAVAGLLLLVR
jgi:hypothetical protein